MIKSGTTLNESNNYVVMKQFSNQIKLLKRYHSTGTSELLLFSVNHAFYSFCVVVPLLAKRVTLKDLSDQ